MLELLLAMILGTEFEVEPPEVPPGMVCDGPMITMDPTFSMMIVPEGDQDMTVVNITNNCNQDLILGLEFSGVQVQHGATPLGEIRLVDDRNDLARGGEGDDLGLISLTGLVLRAYETDVRGVVFYANEIESADPEQSTYHREDVWLDVSVLDDTLQPVFPAETVFEVTVYELPKGSAGGFGS